MDNTEIEIIESLLPSEEPRVLSAEALLSEETVRAKTEMAWQLFETLENQVQVADRKVQAIFAANTLLVAAVSFQDQNALPALHQGHLPPLAALELAVRLLLLGSICVSSLTAIIALFPRLRVAEAVRPRSLLFFGDIATLPADRFVAEFLETTPTEKARQLLHQAHTVSLVVAEKFRWTRRAGTALVVSLLLWITVELIKILSGT